MTSVKEHYDWCVTRAEEYLDMGDAQGGFNSFAMDMMKNPETDSKINRTLMFIGMMEISHGPEAVRRWIRGFNF